MSKFQPMEAFEAPLRAGYRLLPFNFTKLDGADYVLTNVVGEIAVLERQVLEAFVRHDLDFRSPAYDLLKSKHFLLDDDSNVALDLLGLKTRTKLYALRNFTALHIFVVTLRCEHSCPYCQVSRQTDDKVAYDMSTVTADAALQMVFRSPSPTIKIEFQGGEPLLNFEMVRYVVEKALERNQREGRDLQFVIATNLALLDDEVLEFCRRHEILLSTSLDGPEDLHNRNRPRPGKNSYQLAVAGIRLAQKALGPDRVSALMTTTLASLPRVREIIDEYVRLDLDGIFLRPLSPYGFAIRTKSIDAYNSEAWLRFYKEGLEYVLDLNRGGSQFVEQYAMTVLSKMLTPTNPGYVDLMSPAGAAIAALVYNYDGDVYASDEARMLAEMGDKTFRLGNLHTDRYEDMMLSDVLLDALDTSYAGSAPMCSECAFEPFCGAEPVYHHATQGDFVGRKPLSDFCRRNMAIDRHLIQMMRKDEQAADIFRRWVAHTC